MEGETATSNESERTEDADGHATDRMAVETEEEQSSWSGAAGWPEREEAYTYGVRLLEAMTTNGYLVEVRLRLTGSWYQVVLIGEDCELVLEIPRACGICRGTGKERSALNGPLFSDLSPRRSSALAQSDQTSH